MISVCSSLLQHQSLVLLLTRNFCFFFCRISGEDNYLRYIGMGTDESFVFCFQVLSQWSHAVDIVIINHRHRGTPTIQCIPNDHQNPLVYVPVFPRCSKRQVNYKLVQYNTWCNIQYWKTWHEKLYELTSYGLLRHTIAFGSKRHSNVCGNLQPTATY
jgi:hypothetical protein